MVALSLRRAAQLFASVLLALAAFPAAASAHGPVAPSATSYLAKVGRIPAGLRAQVVDGDQRMWLRVAANETVVVLDYRGAPYLRFSRSGVAVNKNSSMYYLNQVPAELPPANLGPTTAPSWSGVSSARSYSWHDGRLHALATVALAPGATYVGRWSIPIQIDQRSSALSGGVWYSPNPSIVWFWPIAVLLACVLAARRVRRPELDRRVARVLAVAALIASPAAAAARELHGRPTISVEGAIIFAVIVAFVVVGLRRVLFGRPGYFTHFAISFVALWLGAELIPTLTHGFVLTAVPAVVARVATVICLGCGAGLLLLVFRLAEQSDPDPLDVGDPNGDAGVADAGTREAYA